MIDLVVARNKVGLFGILQELALRYATVSHFAVGTVKKKCGGFDATESISFYLNQSLTI